MIWDFIWKQLNLPLVYRSFGTLTGGWAFRDFVLREWFSIQTGESVLDIGCGPAEWLSIFPEVDYTGIDYNPRYIEEARQKYGNRGKFIIASADADFGSQLGKYDLVIATGLLHHLSEDEVFKVLSLAEKVMKPDARLITLDGVLCQKQSPLARWMVLRDRGRFIRPADEYLSILRQHFSSVTHEIYYNRLRIPYTHIIAKCVSPHSKAI